MSTYQIEFLTSVYVTIPVDADSLAEAIELADHALPRYPVITELSQECPAGASVTISKEWEVNRDVLDEDEDEGEDED